MDKLYNRSEVVANGINTVSAYHDISAHGMNENIYLGDLIEQINNVPGVLNIIDIRVYNPIGGAYGSNEISQPFIDNTTRQIQLIDYTIFGETLGQFQILDSTKDIVFRVKTN
jgi:hypothetical protein